MAMRSLASMKDRRRRDVCASGGVRSDLEGQDPWSQPQQGHGPDHMPPPARGLLWPVQAKVAVGAAHDAAEVEADDVARRVVDTLRRSETTERAETPAASASVPDALRRSGDAERAANPPPAPAIPEALHRTAERAPVGPEGGDLDEGSESALRTAAGGGTPLPEPLRTRLEPAMGANLSGIRLHTDDRAKVLNRSVSALAFTHGSDVFFRDGMPDTGSTSGMHLLVHELAHSVQQGSAPGATASRTTTGPVRRLLQFDGTQLQGLISTKSAAMGMIGKSSWDDVLAGYRKYQKVVAGGSDPASERKALDQLKTDAKAWLRKRAQEFAKAASKGKDGKHSESQADQNKRSAIMDLLGAIDKETRDLDVRLSKLRAVRDLGLPPALVDELPANAVSYLVEANDALAAGNVGAADACLGVVRKAMAASPTADAARDGGTLMLIKSSLMRRHVGMVDKSMKAAFDDPKYKITNAAEVQAGAGKVQSLATDRFAELQQAKPARQAVEDTLMKLPANDPQRAALQAQYDKLDTQVTEARFHGPTLKDLRGAAGQMRVAQPQFRVQPDATQEEKDAARKDAESARKRAFKGLTDEEASAIIGYSTSLYPGFNGPLRAGIQNLAGDQAALTKLTISGLNKLPAYTGQAYRHGQNFPGYAQVNRVGGIVTDMAFMSTAREQAGCVGGGEYHEVLEVITSKSGRDISPLSAFGAGEAEVLFKPGARFQVTRVVHRTAPGVWPDQATQTLADETGKRGEIQMVVYKVEV